MIFWRFISGAVADAKGGGKGRSSRAELLEGRHFGYNYKQNNLRLSKKISPSNSPSHL